MVNVLEIPDVSSRHVTMFWINKNQKGKFSDEDLVHLVGTVDPSIILEEVESPTDFEEYHAGRCVSPVFIPEDVRTRLMFEVEEIKEAQGRLAAAMEDVTDDFAREYMETEVEMYARDAELKERALMEEVFPMWLVKKIAEAVEVCECCDAGSPEVKAIYFGTPAFKDGLVNALAKAPEVNVKVVFEKVHPQVTKVPAKA